MAAVMRKALVAGSPAQLEKAKREADEILLSAAGDLDIGVIDESEFAAVNSLSTRIQAIVLQSRPASNRAKASSVTSKI